MESFTIHTEQGFNGNEMVFTVGNDTTESKIKFSVNVDNDDYLLKTPYNADIFKEILKANKTCESGEIFVYSEGLLVVKFIDNQIESKYYLVRNQN
jgi:DNA topoisomerase VI subunit A